jgi:hypothetical protein
MMTTLLVLAAALQAAAPQEPAGSLEALDREVAAFPAERKAGYALFRSRCSSCHTVQRALSARVPDWPEKVRKMARKQGAGISPEEAEEIAGFLDYLAARRRGDAAPPEREARKDPAPEVSFSGALLADFNLFFTRKAAEDALEEEGFVGELTLGAGATIGRRISITVGACYGCHRLEFHQAFGDYQISDFLRVRAGRFPVPLGAFHQRYLPSHRESPSKPLPFGMGLIPHAEEFNQGVMPSPLVDTGASLLASARPWDDLLLDLEVYAVRGLKGISTDFDFISSRDELEDNNGEPAAGARGTAQWGPLSAGFSAMAGSYDAAGDLEYRVGGADLMLKLGEVRLGVEVLRRETEFLGPAPGLSGREWVKEGYVVQLDGPLPLLEGLRFFALADGMSVRNIYLGPVGPTTTPTPATTDDRNRVFRGVAGLEYAPDPGVLLKASAERWAFSDFDDAWVFHLAAVYMF